MTTFQKQINARPAKGVPGDKAGLNPHVYTIGNPVADGPVTVGGFVWDGAESGQAKSTGTGAPLGFVELEYAAPNKDTVQSIIHMVSERFGPPSAGEGDHEHIWNLGTVIVATRYDSAQQTVSLLS